MASIRQPIVSVLGHVDHGKTTLLHRIRGTGVAGREARGGALADLAVLVIDVNEGFRPQTIESLNILKRYKTPFIVAANKIDLVPGWRKHDGTPFHASYSDQPESARGELDKRMYELVGRLYEHGFSADRYDRIEDFTTNLAVVPVSAKHSEGIADMLLMLIGLAQRFLEPQLEAAAGPAEGTILEVKEEKGLGVTLDAIIYQGVLAKGDTVVFGTTGKPGTTKVKALLKPKPLDEIRDPQERFDSVASASAASGVKIVGSGLERAVAGAPIRVARGNVAAVVEEVAKESQVHIETQDEGILVKADAIGSLEGLAYECKQASIPIKYARIGPVSRRDVTDAATAKDPLLRAILAFNLEILPDAKTARLEHPDLAFLESDVIYRLIEDYGTWRDERKRAIETANRKAMAYPAKLLFLGEHVFRTSKPAIFGVRILAGRIRTGEALMRDDGRALGRIKSVRSGEKSLDGAGPGQEVAISVDGITIGRQINGGDVLYVDLPEADARTLRVRTDLGHDEVEALDQIIAIKRKEDPFWGM